MKMKFVRQQKKEDPRTRLDIGSKGPQESVNEPDRRVLHVHSKTKLQFWYDCW